MTNADFLTDIHVMRRAQLRMLIDQRAAGNIAAFSDQFGYSRSRVSQFLSDTYNEGRSIGERAARALEEVAGVPFGWLDQASGDARKFSGVSTVDHAAALRGAIAQTRLVFEGHRDAQDALEYLEQMLKAGQHAEVPAHACAPADRVAAAMAAESAQLVIQAEKAAAGPAARATVDPLAVLSREVFGLSNKLHQPVDLVVQLLVLAELRGMRAERSVATRGEKIADALCVAAASGTSHHSLEQLCESLVAAVRAIPADLSSPSTASRIAP